MGNYSQAGRPLRIDTPLETDTLLLEAFEAEEGLSRPYLYAAGVVVRGPGDRAGVDPPRAGSAHRVDGRRRRRVSCTHGVIRSFVQLDMSEGLARYRAEVVPAMWFLTQTTDCKIFQNMSVIEIVSEVLDKPRAVGTVKLRGALLAQLPEAGLLRAVQGKRLQLRVEAARRRGHLLLLRTHDRRPHPRSRRRPDRLQAVPRARACANGSLGCAGRAGRAVVRAGARGAELRRHVDGLRSASALPPALRDRAGPGDADGADLRLSGSLHRPRRSRVPGACGVGAAGEIAPSRAGHFGLPWVESRDRSSNSKVISVPEPTRSTTSTGCATPRAAATTAHGSKPSSTTRTNSTPFLKRCPTDPTAMRGSPSSRARRRPSSWARRAKRCGSTNTGA